MKKQPTQNRNLPEPSDSSAEVDDWAQRVMPDLQPIVECLDNLIRESIPDLQYGVKWKRAYYGTPDRGWVIELVAYDVSVNVVFLSGAVLDPPPPLGDGRSRYVKVRTREEAKAPELRDWVEQAGRTPGRRESFEEHR